MIFNLSEKTRAWVYRVFLAAVGLAVIYGVVSGEEVAAWVAFVTALLGNGLAVANTTTKTPDAPVEGEV